MAQIQWPKWMMASLAPSDKRLLWVESSRSPLTYVAHGGHPKAGAASRPIAGKPAPTGTGQARRLVISLWEIAQAFGLRCRAGNKARERAADPVGATVLLKLA